MTRTVPAPSSRWVAWACGRALSLSRPLHCRPWEPAGPEGTAVVRLRLGDPLSAGAQVLENSWSPGTGFWAQRPHLPSAAQGGRGPPPASRVLGRPTAQAEGSALGLRGPDQACSRLTSRF